MKLISKRTIAAAGLTAAAAAVLFGGSSVATSWTQSSQAGVHADAAQVSNDFKTGNITLNNAVPGDTSQAVPVSYTNRGSTPEDLTISIVPSNSSTLPAGDLNLVGSVLGGSVPFSQVPNGVYDLGPVQPGDTRNFGTIAIQLADGANGAPISDQGKTFEAVYTLTATALSVH